MKLINRNEKTIVFLNNLNIKNIDIHDEDSLEEYLKLLFSKINDKYNLELNNYYNINVYNDLNYGVIIEIEQEELNYYNYFNDYMKINISDISLFLYEIDIDYLNNDILNFCTCYKNKNKVYLKINNINECNYMYILEYANIIYGEEVKKILEISEKVKL